MIQCLGMDNPCCGLNVKDQPFCAKGDVTKVKGGGKIDIGSRKLIFGINHLMKAGENINIEGAGLDGGGLSTKIKSVDLPTEVTLDNEASTGVDSAKVVWGTDDSNAIIEAIKLAYRGGGGGIICFEQGTYLVTKDLSVHSNITLTFTQGSQIYLADNATLTIRGTISAPLRQIFSGTGRVIIETGQVPRVYPQWWGANSDEKMIEETTKAIQAAANSLQNSTNPRVSPVLEFVPGEYWINDEIVLGAWANKVIGSGAVVRMKEKDPSIPKNIFNFNSAYMLQVKGLQFYGGETQISISNTNVDTCMFHIDQCEFHLSKNYAISATPIEPNDHLSAILTIDNCKFFLPAKVLENYCDYAGINNCWITVRSTPKVNSISPKHLSKGIPIDTSIVVEFEYPVLSSTFTTSSIILKNGSGIIDTDLDIIPEEYPNEKTSKKVIITPTTKLQTSTTYTVTFTKDIKDKDGISLADSCVTTFTTATNPTDIPIIPVDANVLCPFKSYALFLNKHGRLYFHNMFGVPRFPQFSGCRWIDNYGSVLVDNSRFGGEAAGLSIIYHYTEHWHQDGRWQRPPTSVIIRDSWVFTGYNGKEGEHAVLVLKSDIPTVFIYEGNFGPAGGPPSNFYANPLIRDGGVKPDLQRYIDEFPPNYFKFVIEPNDMTVDDLPEPLRFLVINQERFGTSKPTKPTKGVWKQGEHIWNSDPKPGGILGWVCVKSGSPGEWREFGTIT